MYSNTKKTIVSRISKLLLLMCGASTFLVIAAFCLENAIGSRIVAEIQANLKTELKVEKADFSLITSFPYAALNLKNISIQGTDKAPLLKAGSLRFKINIWSIFDSPITIKALSIKDGVLLLKIADHGGSNFDILKQQKKEKKEDVAFVLEKANLKNIIIGYQNAQNKEDAGVTITNATFKGALSEKKFNLLSKADLLCHGISKNGKSFLVNNDISYETELQVDRLKQIYDIQTFALDLEENKFDINGKIEILKKAANLDLKFKARECSIGSLLAIFPQATIQNLSSEGHLTVNGSIKGIQSAISKPTIIADIQLKNGTLKSPKLVDVLEKVNFSAKLHTNQNGSSFIVPDFQGYFGKQPLELKLSVTDFKNPIIDLYLNGKIPLASTYTLAGIPDLHAADGHLALINIQILGHLADMKKVENISKVSMSGILEAENISLLLKNEAVTIPQGTLRFDNNSIAIENIAFEGAGSQFFLAGNFTNLLPVLLDESPHNDARLNFNVKLSSAAMDAKRIAVLFQPAVNNPTNSAQKIQQNTSEKNKGLALLNGTFDAKIDNLTYDKINVKHFDGSIGFELENILLKGKLETMQGKMALNGRLSLANAPNLSAVIDGEDFDMVEFFEQCDNFGQQVIKKENVSGRLDCQLAIDAFWDNEWNFIDKNLYVLAHLSIHEGRIKGLKMLDNFSTYVKSEDLKDIKFNTLENWFEVSNRTLRIPTMNIKSNALQLTLSGSHSFDNYINYNVKINAANIVYARLKKSGTDADLQEQLDQNGLLDMYFNLNGPIDKYKVQMSRKIVKGDFEESVLLKKKIQAKLQSLLKGKQIPLPDQEIIEDFKTVSNMPKNHAQKNHRSTTEKIEYIDGF